MSSHDELKQSILERLAFFGPIMDQFEMGLMLIDPHDTIHWANPYLLKMELCCQDIEQVIKGRPSRIEFARCGDCSLIDICKTPDIPTRFCKRHENKSGPPGRSFNVMCHAIFDAEDQPAFYIQIIRDETDQEEAYRSRQELQMMMSNVLDNTADAVLTLDQKRIIYSWNRGAWQVFGYTKSEMRTQHVEKLIPEEEESRLQFQRIQRLLDEQGFVRNQRARMITKDQRIIDVAVTQTAMQNLHGEPLGFSLIIRDISNVVHLEHSFEQKVDQLTKLLQIDDIIRKAKTLEEIYTAILVAVTAGEGLRFNRAFLFAVSSDSQALSAVLGVSPQRLEGVYYDEDGVDRDHLTLAEIIQLHHTQAAEGETHPSLDLSGLTISMKDTENPIIRCLLENRPFLYIKGGADDAPLADLLETIQSEQFVCVPLIWQDQRLGIIMADNDLSQQSISMEAIQFLISFANRAASAISNIQLQEDLQAKVEELKKAYQQVTEMQGMSLQRERLAALGEMSSKVAHEIRNPLASIGGFARLLRKTSTSNENIHFLDIILSETTRLEGILEEVLGYVKPSVTDMTPCNLNILLNECRELAEQQRHSTYLRHPDITINMNLDRNLPTVTCNEHRLKQAFLNLIQNGMESMSGSGELTISSKQSENHAIVSISDSGSGISQSNLRNLFKPFFTTKSRGVGLGLSVTRQIIDSHNGKIEVDSTLGKGTTFTITIPFRYKEGIHDELTKEEASYR